MAVQGLHTNNDLLLDLVAKLFIKDKHALNDAIGENAIHCIFVVIHTSCLANFKVVKDLYNVDVSLICDIQDAVEIKHCCAYIHSYRYFLIDMYKMDL